MNRYGIDGTDKKYQITFEARAVDDALWDDPEYRRLMALQRSERSQLFAGHAAEELRFVLAWKRARDLHVPTGPAITEGGG